MRKAVTMLAIVLLVAAGCQKLNHSETAEVKMGLLWEKGFSAPAYNQDVKVTIEPESGAVSAYLVTDDNRETFKETIERLAPGKAPEAKLFLAGKSFSTTDEKQDFVLEATVPARTPYWLILSGGKKTTKVKVKVVGK